MHITNELVKGLRKNLHTSEEHNCFEWILMHVATVTVQITVLREGGTLNLQLLPYFFWDYCVRPDGICGN